MAKRNILLFLSENIKRARQGQFCRTMTRSFCVSCLYFNCQYVITDIVFTLVFRQRTLREYVRFCGLWRAGRCGRRRGAGGR